MWSWGLGVGHVGGGPAFVGSHGDNGKCVVYPIKSPDMQFFGHVILSKSLPLNLSFLIWKMGQLQYLSTEQEFSTLALLTFWAG